IGAAGTLSGRHGPEVEAAVGYDKAITEARSRRVCQHGLHYGVRSMDVGVPIDVAGAPEHRDANGTIESWSILSPGCGRKTEQQRRTQNKFLESHDSLSFCDPAFPGAMIQCTA